MFERGGRFVQSWGTASETGELCDYSVCATWLIKGRDYYLMDVWRGRVMFPDRKRQVYVEASKWGIDILLIEDKGSGTRLIDQLLDDDVEDLPRPLGECRRRTR